MAATRLLGLVVLLGASLGCGAAPPDGSVQDLDLRQFSKAGLPPTLAITLYRPTASTDKRPLIVILPAFGAQITDHWFSTQAAFFTHAGYVVAVPHLDGMYDDGVHTPEYNVDMSHGDLADLATPFALQVLATVAVLTQSGGPAAADHVVLGEQFGSLIAARYAALNPPGCKGLIMVSAGFGPHGIALREDMRYSEDAFSGLGHRVKIPSLWLYAKGNQRISEATENELFTLFRSGGAPATLTILPELGMNGDSLFSNPAAPPTWQSPVSKFLASVGLP
jgi:pimeloyl-ACP methyl ester carboxylesterase